MFNHLHRAGCVELAMTHRSASGASLRRTLLATCWRPGNVVCPQRSPGTCSPAPRPLPPAGKWVRFSCSISPLFVLSRNMSMVNATSKLASFWRFSITAGSLRSDSLANLLLPHAPRLTPHQRGQVVRGPSPLATACHRQSNWQRPNGIRSRRVARLY